MRRSEEQIAKWLTSPELMSETDPDAQAMLITRFRMPNQNLKDEEVRRYSAYNVG